MSNKIPKAKETKLPDIPETLAPIPNIVDLVTEPPKLNVNGEYHNSPSLPKEITVEPFNLKKFRDEQRKLVRISIKNLDPNDSGIQGVYRVVSNKYLGTFKRYIPYSSPKCPAWHVEWFIVKSLLRDKYFTHKGDKHGTFSPSDTSSKEYEKYSIEILDPLSKEQLNELAQIQKLNEVESD